MVRPTIPHHIQAPDDHQGSYSRTIFGFWLYLMTDCVLFGVVFAVYAVLITGTAGGVTPKEIIHLPFVLIETLLLLTSSFTIAVSMRQALYNHKKQLLAWLGATFLLGLLFLGMQGAEMSRLLTEGHSFQKSAFLSAYFTLLATHGIHILFGLLFMIVFAIQAMRRGVNPSVLTRLTCLRLFWLFLDLVWIAMFTYVYLLGVQ